MRIRNLSILLPLGLAACATSAVNENYGKAVEQMLRAQTYNPATLNNPSDRAVESMDPESAKTAIDSMRKDTPDRSAVLSGVPISVTKSGGGSGSGSQ